MELLPVPPLETLRSRRSEKWRTYPDDVLPLPVAEMNFDLAPPVAAALREAVDRSDTGYPAAVQCSGRHWQASPVSGGDGTSTRRQ